MADSGGYPDPHTYLAEFGQRIGYPVSREEWVEARREAMQPWPEMLSLAARLGSQARIAIYSNNGPLTRATLPDLFPGLCEVFGEHYHSYEFGMKKPAPASFAKLMERMGTDPARCWFIDDKRSNVIGARMAGLKAHHFRSREKLLPDVLALGFDA